VISRWAAQIQLRGQPPILFGSGTTLAWQYEQKAKEGPRTYKYENNFPRFVYHLRDGPHIIVSVDMPFNEIPTAFGRERVEPMGISDFLSNPIFFNLIYDLSS
jgi:hypothetical protein